MPSGSACSSACGMLRTVRIQGNVFLSQCAVSELRLGSDLLGWESLFCPVKRSVSFLLAALVPDVHSGPSISYQCHWVMGHRGQFANVLFFERRGCWNMNFNALLFHTTGFSTEARGRQGGRHQRIRRYLLIRVRYWYEQWRCRDERLQCAATRRVTSRMGVVSGSANLEKTGCIAVKIQNKCRVFQCTVNWARARLSLALIASGAAGSSRIFSVGEV